MTSDKQRFEELRIALQKAKFLLSYEQIVDLIHKFGFRLTLTPDALRKFGVGDTQRISKADDVRNLEKFFFTTEVGRILRRSPDDGACVLDNILASVRVRLPSEREDRINGRYHGFHGAITKRTNFAVRLLTARRQENAIVHITSKIIKERNAQVADYFQAEGFLVFEKEEFQILMYHRNDKNQPNNLLGLNLIVFDRNTIEPYDGPLTSVVARMIGITKNGDYFIRNLLVKRIADDISDDEALARTGDYTKRELPEDFLKDFEYLANNLNGEKIVDPIYKWSKS